MTSTERRQQTGGVPLVAYVPADPAHLHDLRRKVTDAARAAGADDDIVSALQLAVSELATNVIEHTDAERIEVTLHRHDDDWVVEMTDPPGDASPRSADLDDITGRGLLIVNAVMDHVAVVEEDDRRIIRCVKRDAAA